MSEGKNPTKSNKQQNHEPKEPEDGIPEGSQTHPYPPRPLIFFSALFSAASISTFLYPSTISTFLYPSTISIITFLRPIDDKNDTEAAKELAREIANAFSFYGAINFCALLALTLFILFNITKSHTPSDQAKVARQGLKKAVSLALCKLVILEISLGIFGLLASLALGIPIHPTQENLKAAATSTQRHLMGEPWQPLKGAIALLVAYAGYRNWKSLQAQAEAARSQVDIMQKQILASERRDLESSLTSRFVIALKLLNKRQISSQLQGVNILITLIDECDKIIHGSDQKNDWNSTRNFAHLIVETLCAHARSMGSSAIDAQKNAVILRKIIESLLSRQPPSEVATRIQDSYQSSDSYTRAMIRKLFRIDLLKCDLDILKKPSPRYCWQESYTYDFSGMSLPYLNLSGMSIGCGENKVLFEKSYFTDEVQFCCSTIGPGARLAGARFEKETTASFWRIERGADFTGVYFEGLTLNAPQIIGKKDEEVSFKDLTVNNELALFDIRHRWFTWDECGEPSRMSKAEMEDYIGSLESGLGVALNANLQYVDFSGSVAYRLTSNDDEDAFYKKAHDIVSCPIIWDNGDLLEYENMINLVPDDLLCAIRCSED
ncbi:hypothetical protein ACUH9H_04340 [Dermabacteraceae bacterium P13128]